MSGFSPLPSVAPATPRILLGIEHEWAARALESVLSPGGFAPVRAHSGAQAIDLAKLVSPDVILLDSRLADIGVLEVVRQLRQPRQRAAHVPIVILTSGASPREFVLEAHRAGAWDVWEQPLDAEVVLLRLQTWVQAKRVGDDAVERGLVDAASGVYSFRGLNVRAAEVLSDASRRRTPTSCVAVGTRPAAGIPVPQVATTGDDDELGVLGRSLAEVARGSDVVGRLSATGFAVLAPATSQAGAEELARRLRTIASGLGATKGLRLGGAPTIAIGVVTLDADESAVSSPVELLSRAAAAMRFAQSSPADAIRSYDEVPLHLR